MLGSLGRGGDGSANFFFYGRGDFSDVGEGLQNYTTEQADLGQADEDNRVWISESGGSLNTPHLFIDLPFLLTTKAFIR